MIYDYRVNKRTEFWSNGDVTHKLDIEDLNGSGNGANYQDSLEDLARAIVSEKIFDFKNYEEQRILVPTKSGSNVGPVTLFEPLSSEELKTLARTIAKGK
ncbi:MAG: hypothetical protein WC781_03540 [Candidatus Pacearchaeota archaeon]|jgi:hypothetical protein